MFLVNIYSPLQILIFRIAGKSHVEAEIGIPYCSDVLRETKNISLIHDRSRISNRWLKILDHCP